MHRRQLQNYSDDGQNSEGSEA